MMSLPIITTKIPLGVDVSQSTLDYCLLARTNQTEKGQLANTKKKIIAFLEKYDPDSVFIVAEPTGTYSDKCWV